jgi:hypothetical protein
MNFRIVREHNQVEVAERPKTIARIMAEALEMVG